MLKVRIIPTLLWKNFGLVKGESFDSWRRVGSVLPAIKLYNSREVDELVLLDIEATKTNTIPDIDSIKDLSVESSVPFTVGGGINKLDQVLSLLHAGADKVSVNSAIYENPYIITEVAKNFGTQCIVASIDVRKIEKDKYICFSHSGSKNTQEMPVNVAKRVEDLGAGEILITSIDLDGTMRGYDLELVESIVNSVNVPVIASGGCGSYQDMVDVILKSGASAVAAASIFHFTELTPSGAKQSLIDNNIPVRKNFVPED